MNRQTNPILAFDAKPTRARAIKAMCAQCMGCTREAIEPGFKAEIRACTAKGCALWRFRPYQERMA